MGSRESPRPFVAASGKAIDNVTSLCYNVAPVNFPANAAFQGNYEIRGSVH